MSEAAFGIGGAPIWPPTPDILLATAALIITRRHAQGRGLCGWHPPSRIGIVASAKGRLPPTPGITSPSFIAQ